MEKPQFLDWFSKVFIDQTKATPGPKLLIIGGFGGVGGAQPEGLV
jgi:hypothetical protein